jgi:hypothetical protein
MAMRSLLLFSICMACGGSLAGERASRAALLADAGDAGSVDDGGPSGSCLIDGGGFYGIETDAGFTHQDGGEPGPTAQELPLEGTWRVVAPVCYSGTLEAHGGGGPWNCGTWVGSIVAKPDRYYAGGWVLDIRPDPSAWQYASEARVTFISPNEIHAAMLDGYWGFIDDSVFLCRASP